MRYDDWKATNPEDEFLEPAPESAPAPRDSLYDFGDCEYCDGSGSLSDTDSGNWEPCVHCDGTGDRPADKHVDETDEQNPVLDPEQPEMRDTGHADPSGKEWSSGLDQATAVEGQEEGDSEPVTECHHFDRFMDEVLLKERKAIKSEPLIEAPSRTYAKRWRETPHNRMRIVKR